MTKKKIDPNQQLYFIRTTRRLGTNSYLRLSSINTCWIDNPNLATLFTLATAQEIAEKYSDSRTGVIAIAGDQL